MTTRLAVIGAGPGGYAAAFHAADLGMKVTLIDAEPNPGGVCTFRGCIPSKALLHAAKVLDEAKHAEAFGVSFGTPAIDVNKLRAWKDEVVKKQTGGLGLLAKSRKVDYVQGTASIVDGKTLRVETAKGTQRVDTDYIIIATGSRPTAVPNVSIDSPKVLDSTTALELPDVPNRLLIVGGGYIGLELGTVYAALGSKVTVVEMTDGLLPGADRDLAAVVAKRMETYCEAILLATKVTAVKEDKKGLSVTLEGKNAPAGAQIFDRVLVAVGPASELEHRRARQDESQGESARLHRSGRAAPHRRTVHLCHRRRRRRSDAGAQGVARSARRGRSDSRPSGGSSPRGPFRPSSSPIRSSRGRG